MISIFMIVLAFALIRLFTSIWLQIWLDDGDGQVQSRLNESIAMNITLTDEELRGNIADNPDRWFYQLIHGLSLIFMILVGVIKGYSLALALLKGASNLHERMLMSVMRCPMSFFDSTPSGRVLNRFSKDMDESKAIYFNTVWKSMNFSDTQILREINLEVSRIEKLLF